MIYKVRVERHQVWQWYVRGHSADEAIKSAKNWAQTFHRSTPHDDDWVTEAAAAPDAPKADNE